MKIAITTIVASALLAGSTFVSVASAGNLTAEREARTARIEALLREVSSGRLTRSERIRGYAQIEYLQGLQRDARYREIRQVELEAARKSRRMR